MAEAALRLTTRLAAVPARGGKAELRRLFAPRGYAVSAEPHPLDPALPARATPFFTVEPQAANRLRDRLSHLSVLVPVLDIETSDGVGDDEVAELLRHGAGGLAKHPGRGLIAERYRKHRSGPIADAPFSLVDVGATSPAATEAANKTGITGAVIGGQGNRHRQRRVAVVAALADIGARRVLDLGRGEGRPLERLAANGQYLEIIAVDTSTRALTHVRRRLDRLPSEQRGRLALLYGALTYHDRRLNGLDGEAVIEVIEHLDWARLAASKQVRFDRARPGTVVVTTPDQEYSARFRDPAAGGCGTPTRIRAYPCRVLRPGEADRGTLPVCGAPPAHQGGKRHGWAPTQIVVLAQQALAPSGARPRGR